MPLNRHFSEGKIADSISGISPLGAKILTVNNSTMAFNSTVRSSISFLQRDPLYDSEKPYEHRREDWPNVPPTNAKMERLEDIPIHNMRGMDLSIATHGFFCMNLRTGLSPEDFQQSSKIVEEYFPQLTQALKASLNADRIQIYDFTVYLLPQLGLKLIFCSDASDTPTIPASRLSATLMVSDSQPLRRTLVFLLVSKRLLLMFDRRHR